MYFKWTVAVYPIAVCLKKYTTMTTIADGIDIQNILVAVHFYWINNVDDDVKLYSQWNEYEVKCYEYKWS